MAGSVYKFIEIVGTSDTSWEDAAKGAIAQANKSLRDLRIAEVLEQDMQIEAGEIVQYRVKLKLSFKFEG